MLLIIERLGEAEDKTMAVVNIALAVEIQISGTRRRPAAT